MSGEHLAENDYLTDEEMDRLRDWWDEETTVGVESSFPIIARIVRAHVSQALGEDCDGSFACPSPVHLSGCDAEKGRSRLGIPLTPEARERRAQRLRELTISPARPAPSPCSHGRRFCEECRGDVL